MVKTLAAIAGGESLLGKEIHELASAQFRLRVLGGEETGVAVIAQEEDELTVLARLEKDNLKDAGVVVLAASSLEVCREALAMTPKKTPVIDAKGLLDDIPGARLFRPGGDKARLLVVPAAASQVLARWVSTLATVQPVSRSIVTILEPCSEWGQGGVAELQGQSVSLLTFKPVTKTMFDAQLAFTLLAGFGEEAKVSLAAKEARIERHLASLLAAVGGPPLPSIQLIQAPVFHGYSMSAWVEFEKPTTKEKLEVAFAKAGVDVRDGSLEPPNNIGIAQQGGYAVGSIRPDNNNPLAFWMWIVSDNVRVVADAAVEAMKAATE